MGHRFGAPMRRGHGLRGAPYSFHPAEERGTAAPASLPGDMQELHRPLRWSSSETPAATSRPRDPYA